MTTNLINGTYTNGINAFRSAKAPASPLPFLFALVDCIREQGPDWLGTDEAKALLFPVLLLTYGTTFHLDSAGEFRRLDKVIPRA